jgi:hypothetical protein
MRKAVYVIILCALLCLASLLYVFSLPTVTRFQASKYDDLLHRLATGNYSFVLVHDCDYRIEGLQTLIAVEKVYNVRSTCFVRPDSEYLSYSIDYLQGLEHAGWGIGFHYDCLSRTAFKTTDLALHLGINWIPQPWQAMRLFKAQLAFLRTFFNITETRYHGDGYNFEISNRDLYNETAWREMGLTEVSNIPDWSYITDVNGTWREPETLTHNVLVNLHSDWW